MSGTGALGDLLSGWVKAGTDIGRVRADTLGYIQRSFLGCVSEVDQREAREAGVKAVQFVVGGNQSGSTALKRVGDYAIEYILTALKNVARDTNHMPSKFINKEGNDVTAAFIQYAKPLVGNMPVAERISAPPVKKILKRN